MSAIVAVHGRRMWDSRGFPTIEVEVRLESGAVGRAIAPAGASRGSREALDLRDGGPRLRGRDVRHALRRVEDVVAPALVGREPQPQEEIDALLRELDPTPDCRILGGNVLTATSLAVLHAAAREADRPLWRHVAETFGTEPSLPLPEIQIFGGGAHAGRRLDIQDLLVMVPGAASFDEALEVTAEVYHAAGDLLARSGRLCGVADEGGWWPAFSSNEEALETLVAAIELAGERPGGRVWIALDVAASEFGRNGRYRLALEGRELDSAAMVDLVAGWVDSWPIAAVEDPLAEDDRAGWAELTARIGDRVQLVGDDLLVTRAGLVREAAASGLCNAALLKVNQVGTVSGMLEAFRAARTAGFGTIVSARSGESEDVSIAHLAVGLGAGQLKVGALARSERGAKWNEVLRIAEDPAAGPFVGRRPLRGAAAGART